MTPPSAQAGRGIAAVGGQRSRAEAKTLGRGFNPSRGPSSGYLDWNPWGVSNPSPDKLLVEPAVAFGFNRQARPNDVSLAIKVKAARRRASRITAERTVRADVEVLIFEA